MCLIYIGGPFRTASKLKMSRIESCGWLPDLPPNGVGRGDNNVQYYRRLVPHGIIRLRIAERRFEGLGLEMPALVGSADRASANEQALVQTVAGLGEYLCDLAQGKEGPENWLITRQMFAAEIDLPFERIAGFLRCSEHYWGTQTRCDDTSLAVVGRDFALQLVRIAKATGSDSATRIYADIGWHMLEKLKRRPEPTSNRHNLMFIADAMAGFERYRTSRGFPGNEPEVDQIQHDHGHDWDELSSSLSCAVTGMPNEVRQQ